MRGGGVGNTCSWGASLLKNNAATTWRKKGAARVLRWGEGGTGRKLEAKLLNSRVLSARAIQEHRIFLKLLLRKKAQ